MKTIFMSGFLLILLNSCASFQRNKVPKDVQKLTAERLQDLEGTYDFLPNYNYTKEGIVSLDSTKINNGNLFRYIGNKKAIRDTSEAYQVKLRVLTSESLEFALYKGDSLEEKVVLAGKFKRGFYQLDNSEFHMKGLPFIFGSYRSTRTRIGLSSQNELLVYHARGSGGGALIVLSNGNHYSSLKSYKRVL